MKATLPQSGMGIEAYREARLADGLPVILDLGCGAKKVPGAFGVDVVSLPGVDLVHDLEATPYPLPENCADQIYLNHILEHFENPLPIMEEVWRLARPHGQVLIRTPHYSGRYAWIDPTHHRAFSADSFRYFGENNYSYYTSARFRVLHVRLKYFMEEQFWPLPYRAWGSVVQWFLDRHPNFGERFLCYWVGGIDELQATLEALKPHGTTHVSI
ncbi:MAG TPA: class I SAM-dependent methyltransferase [Candidatus Binatia bacterium]|jgi:SAM-dependent methyltransferase|nr:class I SAM-dependent methyltransferase [Candidatus Binatia bacterium]